MSSSQPRSEPPYRTRRAPVGPPARPGQGTDPDGPRRRAAADGTSVWDREPGAPAPAGSRGGDAGVLPPRTTTVQRARPATARGLPAAVVAAVTLAATLVGGFLDALFFDHVSWFFNLAFVLASVWQAARVRRADLVYAVFIPPLVFAVGVVVVQQFTTPLAEGSWLLQQAVGLFATFAAGAPVLFAATALAAVLAVVRGRRARAAELHG